MGDATMMSFNFRLFFRVAYLSLFRSRGTPARLTRRRVAFLLGFYAVFVPLQVVNWLFLLLDGMLFPGYRDVVVREPVFIVGNPRSSSTHLMRVLARDEETFACAKLWELLLAPSITQRKMARALAALDRRVGGGVRSWLSRWQEGAFGEADRYHRIRLDEPDEDEFALMPIFSTIHLVFPFPFLEEFTRYVFFDSEVSPAERKRFMRFYKRSMQRTLYVYGPEKHLLSKSPANSGRIGALCETFPDARFIYTTRTPTSVVPSTLSLFRFQWDTFCELRDGHPFREDVLEMTKHWYRYPMRRLEERPEESYTVVRYEDLVDDLEGTIREIYAAFGLEITPAYAEALKEEVEKARRYESRHEYSLEEMGLTRERILAEYEEAFERFGFERE